MTGFQGLNGGVQDACGRLISETFDRILKRHHDEAVFWEGLFADKIAIFADTGRTDWDSPASRRYYELLFQDFTRLVSRSASAIEMGCGTGVLSMLLAAQGTKATIVDRSPRALEYAKIIEKRLRREFTFRGSVSYVNGDVHSLDSSLRGEVVHNCGVIEEVSPQDAV
jgi:2-polyprenyl-3-methyl-5-hydroxy-6-metoxy-1,4-benzoquinol methylase